MSADLLRRAATVLRHRVAYLPVTAQADWHFQATSLHMDSTGTYQIAAVGKPQVLSSHMHATTAQYLITMHPPVALALAVVLGDMADQMERREYYGYEGNPTADEVFGHLGDLARSILREAPDA